MTAGYEGTDMKLYFMEKNLETQTWTNGEAFTLADCAAAPPLSYARERAPFDPPGAGRSGTVSRRAPGKNKCLIRNSDRARGARAVLP
jgi:glutathione S-transferase